LKESLEKTLTMAENLRLELLKMADRYNAELLRSSSDVPDEDFIMPPQDNWQVEVNESYIKIYAPDIPVRNKNIKKEIFIRWEKNIKAVLWSLKPCPTYNKVFIYIKLFYPGKFWDADNRAIKPIIDGIVRADLIKDDIVSHLAYGVEGNISDNPHTEIYIFDYYNMAKVLPLICNTSCDILPSIN